MRTRRWELAALLVLVGCRPASTPMSKGEVPTTSTTLDLVSGRAPLPPCHAYHQSGPDPNHAEDRCILDAFAEGRAAELEVTQSTIEGDPIVTYVRVLSSGQVEVLVDDRADSFGSRCTTSPWAGRARTVGSLS
jgi:hypothetical protein